MSMTWLPLSRYGPEELKRYKYYLRLNILAAEVIPRSTDAVDTKYTPRLIIKHL